MKIEKGHYVPKELITSEAIHKLVVMCFEAAGGVNDGVLGQYSEVNSNFEGLCITFNDFIVWGKIGCSKPLTLQQLLTAENSIQWPEWANEIRLNQNGNTAYYFSKDYLQLVDSENVRNSRNNVINYTVLAKRELIEHGKLYSEFEIPKNCNLVYVEDKVTVFLKVHENGEITSVNDDATLASNLQQGICYKVADYKHMFKNKAKAVEHINELIDLISNMSEHELLVFKYNNSAIIERLIAKLKTPS